MKFSVKFIFNICTIYIILWGLYGFHWYDSAKGTNIDAWSNMFLGINMAISILILFNLKKIKSIFFRGVNILLLTFVLYGFFYVIGGDTHFMHGHAVNKASYLIGILRSYLPLYAFYYFTKRGYLNQNSITLYFVILFAFSLLYNLFYSQYWVSIGYDNGFTNNLGYVFVSFFPFVFLYKQKSLLQYIILACIVGLTLTSMKRGAIIISFFLFLWFLRTNLSHIKTSKRFIILLMTFVLLTIGYLYINHLYDSSSFFQTRMEQTMEGASSGRDVLYTRLIDHFWNGAGALQQLFGSGPDSTLDILGKEAHNDWLEILICQGLFGVSIFAFFWFNSYKYWKQMPKNTVYYQIVGAFLLTQFLRTFFSMSYSTIPTAATLILGYALAKSEMEIKIKNIQIRNRN